MSNYAKYGKNSSFMNVLSEDELNDITSEDLIGLIHELTSYTHRILYYGPEKISKVVSDLEELHVNKTDLKDIPAKQEFIENTIQISPVLYHNDLFKTEFQYT